MNVIRKTENFCGISGKSIKSETEVTVPAPYHSRLPQINYVAPCLHNCATPPLMGKTMLKEEEFKLDCHKDFLLTPIPNVAEWHLAIKLDMLNEHWVLPLSGKDPEVRWAKLSYGDALTETDWNSVENIQGW